VPKKLTALANSSIATRNQRRIHSNRAHWPLPVRPAVALALHFSFPFLLLFVLDGRASHGGYEAKTIISAIIAAVVFVPLSVWICGVHFQKGPEGGPLTHVGSLVRAPEQGTTPRNRFLRHPRPILTGALVLFLIVIPLLAGASSAVALGLLIIAVALAGIVWIGEVFRR